MGSVSEEEAHAVRRLQRCNTIQQGYLDRPKGLQDKECCWGANELPKHHTSRWVSPVPTSQHTAHTVAPHPNCMQGGRTGSGT